MNLKRSTGWAWSAWAVSPAVYFGDISHQAPVETICERGDPGYAIVAQAESTGCDLIMMPTHGKGPFRGFFLG
jgi:hypothetical protein